MAASERLENQSVYIAINCRILLSDRAALDRSNTVRPREDIERQLQYPVPFETGRRLVSRS